MPENGDVMTSGEKIIFVSVLCGICNLVLCYMGIVCICRKRYSGTGVNFSRQPRDLENQIAEIEGNSGDNRKQVNHIKLLETDDKIIDCCICLDTDDSAVIGLTLCGHKFHKNCIHSINKCPLCRTIIYKSTQQEL